MVTFYVDNIGMAGYVGKRLSEIRVFG